MEISKSIAQESLEQLALLCLSQAEQYHNYTDKDLENATIIFANIVMDKMWEHHSGKLTDEGMLSLATEFGTSLRQSILLFTGKDMHKVVRQSNEKTA